MIEIADGRAILRGGLTIESVPAVFEAGVRYLAAADLEVDFSQVESVDSTAVSLLLGWMRAARTHQRTLRVQGLPAELVSLAQLYGVTDLLPQQNG